MMEFTQSQNSIIYRRKFQHISLLNKQLLTEIPSLNTGIPATKLLKIIENVEGITSKIKKLQIWRFEKRSDNRTWEVENGRNECKKGKFNWKWYKLRSIPSILLLLLIVMVVYSPIQAVTAKLKSRNNAYCQSNSG